MTRDESILALGTALASVQGVRLAFLFGSIARGAERPDSDVDVAVDAAPHVDSGTLSALLSHSVGREIHLVRLGDAGAPLLEQVPRDGVTVCEGTANAAAQWRSHTLGDLEVDRPWYARMRDVWLRRVARRGLDHGRS